jgi:hypothetical protein
MRDYLRSANEFSRRRPGFPANCRALRLVPGAAGIIHALPGFDKQNRFLLVDSPGRILYSLCRFSDMAGEKEFYWYSRPAVHGFDFIIKEVIIEVY